MSGLRLLPALALACPVALAAPAFAEIPEPLESIVFGDEKRPVFQTTIEKVRFKSLRAFSVLPYLLWTAEDDGPEPFARDRAEVQAWLTRHAGTLGYAGFEPRYTETFTWHENEVWSYALVRNGLPMHGARVSVHFDGADGGFLGIENHVPGRIREIVDAPNVLPADAGVYLPVRLGADGYRLVVADVVRIERDDRIEVTVRAPDGRLERTVEPRHEYARGLQGDLDDDGDVDYDDLLLLLEAWGPCDGDCPADLDGDEMVGFGDLLILLGNWGDAPGFTEYPIPVGSFPDQISVAPDGLVWLSQPNDDFFTSFDPSTEQFTQYPTTGGGSGPDGLVVGTLGRVWSGMYYSGSLGLFDSNTDQYHDFPAPYGNAAMAIPVETTDGHVWVTDHVSNRISEFDPENGVWVKSVIMPTGNCWVVQGYEDRTNGVVYFTEFNANQLGAIELGGSEVTDIQVPGGGPAFCVESAGRVYYSRWNENGIGAYDIESGQVTEYEFPVSNERGGPMWVAPDGDIITGTLNRGYIMVFHPDSETFDSYPVPTPNPGLKDGLTVAPNGTIWFTETLGGNKLGKLVLP